MTKQLPLSDQDRLRLATTIWKFIDENEPPQYGNDESLDVQIERRSWTVFREFALWLESTEQADAKA